MELQFETYRQIMGSAESSPVQSSSSVGNDNATLTDPGKLICEKQGRKSDMITMISMKDDGSADVRTKDNDWRDRQNAGCSDKQGITQPLQDDWQGQEEIGKVLLLKAKRAATKQIIRGLMIQSKRDIDALYAEVNGELEKMQRRVRHKLELHERRMEDALLNVGGKEYESCDSSSCDEQTEAYDDITD